MQPNMLLRAQDAVGVIKVAPFGTLDVYLRENGCTGEVWVDRPETMGPFPLARTIYQSFQICAWHGAAPTEARLSVHACRDLPGGWAYRVVRLDRSNRAGSATPAGIAALEERIARPLARFVTSDPILKASLRAFDQRQQAAWQTSTSDLLTQLEDQVAFVRKALAEAFRGELTDETKQKLRHVYVSGMSKMPRP